MASIKSDLVLNRSLQEKKRFVNVIIALNQKFYPGKRDDAILGHVSYWFKQDEIHQATHVNHGPAFVFL